MQSVVYVLLKDINVNTHLLVNCSQKILTGQDINLTITSYLGTSFSPISDCYSFDISQME